MGLLLSFSSLRLAPVFHYLKYAGSRKAHGGEHIPVLQMRKLRHRKVMWLAHDP